MENATSGVEEPRRGNRGATIAFLLTGLLTVTLGADRARAELVILTGGDVLKVAGYRVRNERVRLDLRNGGRMTLPLQRVERIVEDEVVPEPDPIPRIEFPLGFDDSDGAPGVPYGDLILEKARRHAVNSRLVAAVIRAESAFDPSAVSVKGARGLMQVMPATARRFGISDGDLFDPALNLEAGIRYLRWLSQRYPGDLRHVLAAYNAGEQTVERFEGVPPYRETREYILRVYRNLGYEVER